MAYLDTVFGFYDKIISPLSPLTQALISAILLVFLIFQIWHIFKSGHWIFVATLILLLPATWPAALHIGNIIVIVIKFLLTRIQSVF